MILRGRNCLVVDSRLEIKVRMDYLRGQSALCGLAFLSLHCRKLSMKKIGFFELSSQKLSGLMG
jgi:hypothetical protein